MGDMERAFGFFFFLFSFSLLLVSGDTSCLVFFSRFAEADDATLGQDNIAISKKDLTYEYSHPTSSRNISL
jgi:hypothetical protein